MPGLGSFFSLRMGFKKLGPRIFRTGVLAPLSLGSGLHHPPPKSIQPLCVMCIIRHSPRRQVKSIMLDVAKACEYLCLGARFEGQD